MYLNPINFLDSLTLRAQIRRRISTVSVTHTNKFESKTKFDGGKYEKNRTLFFNV